MQLVKAKRRISSIKSCWKRHCTSTCTQLIEGGYVGKTVVFLGIRPEDVYDSEMFIEASPQSVFEAAIKVYELLGAEVYLYFDLENFL